MPPRHPGELPRNARMTALATAYLQTFAPVCHRSFLASVRASTRLDYFRSTNAVRRPAPGIPMTIHGQTEKGLRTYPYGRGVLTFGHGDGIEPPSSRRSGVSSIR